MWHVLVMVSGSLCERRRCLQHSVLVEVGVAHLDNLISVSMYGVCDLCVRLHYSGPCISHSVGAWKWVWHISKIQLVSIVFAKHGLCVYPFTCRTVGYALASILGR